MADECRGELTRLYLGTLLLARPGNYYKVGEALFVAAVELSSTTRLPRHGRAMRCSVGVVSARRARPHSPHMRQRPAIFPPPLQPTRSHPPTRGHATYGAARADPSRHCLPRARRPRHVAPMARSMRACTHNSRTHTLNCTMSSLIPNTSTTARSWGWSTAQYYYAVGVGDTERTFWFTPPLKPSPDAPLRVGLIGDLGQTADSNSTLTHYEQHPGDKHPFHDNNRWGRGAASPRAQHGVPAVDLDHRQPRDRLRAGAQRDGAVQALHPPGLGAAPSISEDLTPMPALRIRHPMGGCYLHSRIWWPKELRLKELEETSLLARASSGCSN